MEICPRRKLRGNLIASISVTDGSWMVPEGFSTTGKQILFKAITACLLPAVPEMLLFHHECLQAADTNSGEGCPARVMTLLDTVISGYI